jgi:cytoskeletal protein RodZ
MTEPDTASVASSDLPATPLAVGPALRSLRESQGLTPEAVSCRIKFSPRQILALEQERWDDLPKGVSLRGLVRSYARLVGADEAALAAMIAPHAGVATARLDDAVRRDAYRPVMTESASNGFAWGWLFVLLLFVAAGLAYAYWQGWLPAGGAATP